MGVPLRGIALPVALVVCGVAACSSDTPPPLQPGAMYAGTAHITVDDQDLGEFQTVQCTPAGTTMTITTGNENSGSTAVVSNAEKLVAQSVAINDLGGFTGSFNQGLGGKADVTMTGGTYSITGTANGFKTDNPSFRVDGTFAIKVAC